MRSFRGVFGAAPTVWGNQKVSLTGSSNSLAFGGARSPNAYSIQEVSGSGLSTPMIIGIGVLGVALIGGAIYLARR